MGVIIGKDIPEAGKKAVILESQFEKVISAEGEMSATDGCYCPSLAAMKRNVAADIS